MVERCVGAEPDSEKRCWPCGGDWTSFRLAVPVVDAKQLHKSYGPRTLLSDLNVTLRSGERVGLLGRNGTGKSTLARILAGIEQPDRGTVSRRRGATVEYLRQEPVFAGEPTAREAAGTAFEEWQRAMARHSAASDAIARTQGDGATSLELQGAADDVERLGGWELEYRVVSMLGQLGIRDVNQPVRSMSGGEQRRVALARLLLAAPNLAVLDEPTNHLDAETVEWLELYLKNDYQGALLLITHDRYLLDRVATRTLELAQGQLYSYDGGYELYLEQKAEREAQRQRTEQNRQNFLRKELEWLRRQPKARATKQKARVERAEVAQSNRPVASERTAAFEVSLARSGKTILELRGLSGGIGSERFFGPLDFCLSEGERIGLVGRNGTGKTTLLRTLLGELPPLGGSVFTGKNTKTGYFDQGRTGLDDEKSVIESVMGDQSGVDVGGETIEPRTYLIRFGFDVKQQTQLVSSLSGGERARATLAKVLRARMNLVFLDEPTNDLDVETLGALEDMLVDRDLTAVVVTHDRWFLDRVATAILAFEGDGRVVLYQGNYSTYRRLRADASAPNGSESSRASSERTEKPRRAVKAKKLPQKQARELQQLPSAIETVEQRISEVSERMGDPAVYADDGAMLAALQKQLDGLRAQLQQAYDRWEELERLQETLSTPDDGSV